jgi:hypothetical protein
LLFLGLAVLHRLTATSFGSREAARRTVLYVAVFPFAYFFTQVYTESLFLLTSVSAVAAAVAGRWGLAGLCGALAALTRPNGILVALPLGLLALSGRPRPAELARRAAALALVPLGLGAFCAVAYRLSGDPLGWLRAQAQWGYSVGNRPWVELMRLLDGLEKHGFYGYFFSAPLAPYYFVHGMVALAFVALTPSVFTRVGPALGAYVAVSLYVPPAKRLEGSADTRRRFGFMAGVIDHAAARGILTERLRCWPASLSTAYPIHTLVRPAIFPPTPAADGAGSRWVRPQRRPVDASRRGRRTRASTPVPAARRTASGFVRSGQRDRSRAIRRFWSPALIRSRDVDRAGDGPPRPAIGRRRARPRPGRIARVPRGEALPRLGVTSPLARVRRRPGRGPAAERRRGDRSGEPLFP